MNLLSADYFANLKTKYKWGSSLFYFISAQKIHPSYTQQLVSDKRYTNKELITILNKIGKKKNHTKFYEENLNNAIESSLNKR